MWCNDLELGSSCSPISAVVEVVDFEYLVYDHPISCIVMPADDAGVTTVCS